MSAQVIEFPSVMEQPKDGKTQTLDAIDQLIRLTLNSMNLEEDLVNHVVGRMRDYIDQYASTEFNCKFDMLVPTHTTQSEKEAMKDCLDKGIDELANQVQTMVNKIIMERVMLEIKIYQDQKTFEEDRRAKEKAVRLFNLVRK